MGYIQPSDFINLGKVNEYVTICEGKAYNQALEDMQKGVKEMLEDNAIYNIDCIDTLVKQLYKR